jgi:HAD superfamily hydrolase (TIGR01509 family)
MKTRKPEPGSYKMVLDHLQLTPAEVLFLDDNADNIAGARSLGITGILVTSPEQMAAELKVQLANG